MRIGVIAPDLEPRGWAEWSDLVGRADDLGVDAVLLRASEKSDSLLLAAALASRTTRIRVVAEVEVTSTLHPVHLAERIAVADQCLAGRLVVVLRRQKSDNDPSLLTETIAVLELALASRPFSFEGAHWKIPAQLDVNDETNWSQLSVTPTPAQFEFPLWLSGSDTENFASREGYVWLAEGGERDAAAPRSERGTRPEILEWIAESDGTPSAVATAENLSIGQRARGVDLVFLPMIEGGVNQTETLVSLVRPRVQLADLPGGLEEFWETTVPADSLES